MLDIKFIRDNLDLVTTALAKRQYVFDRQRFEQLDSERKEATVASQSLQAERKLASKKVGELIKEGMSVDEAKQTVQQTLAKIEDQLQQCQQRDRDIQEQLHELLMATPNLPEQAVPAGRDENDNVEISRWGEPAQFDFTVLDHVAIGEGLGGLDFTTASKLTGSRFVVMQQGVARLHRALTQFMLDTHTQQHGYQEMYVPYIVNADSLRGTAQLPKFAEDQFKLQGDDEYYLIPTAEVPLTNIARDRLFEADEIGEQGLRMVAHTPCFRSEAGSYGRDTRGMIRQHQFEKVELVQLVPAAIAEQALEQLTAEAEAILQALQLPYRKVLLCAGDMGFAAQRTYDLEVWLPAQDCYREISSCSHFGSYQARRMQARWRNPETGKPELLHTLNGSGLAVGRTLVAVLENYQQADGSVLIPEVLQPYMAGLTRIQAA